MRTLLTMVTASILTLGAFAQADISEELPKVKGVVRRVDTINSKIMVKHERIPNLGMAPMTMSFTVADPEMLTDLEPSDKILFTADMVDGETVILWLEKQSEY